MSDWTAARFEWLGLVLRDRALSDPAKLLAAALTNDFASRDTGECWPSWEVLAAFLGKSERTVSRAVADLERSGYLSVDRGNGRGQRTRLSLGLYGEKSALSRSDGSRRAEKVARIVSLTAQKRVSNVSGKNPSNLSGQHHERATDLTRKGVRSVTPYNKVKPRIEPRTRERACEDRKPDVMTDGYHLDSGEGWLVRRWESWLSGAGLPPLDEIARKACHEGRKLWLMPFRFHPRTPEDEAAARSFFEHRGRRRVSHDVAA